MPDRPKIKEKEAESQDREMPLSEHLRELRNRLLICGAVLLLSTLAGLHFSAEIVELLLEMGRSYQYQFVYIAPQELLLQYVSTALVCGVCVTAPVLFYETWAFVQPGLKKHEKALFLFAIIFGLLCFCAGVYFSFWIMLPFMLYFLNTLGSGSSASAAISVQNYISFLTTVLVIFGVVFELPVVSVLLTRLGILKVKWMRKGRRVMVVVIFLVAALITPPDVLSQVMVAVPMLALYELSILLCTVGEKLQERAAKKRENNS